MTVFRENISSLPENVKNVWSLLLSSGYPTVLVGGAVRDWIRGEDPNDFDLATKATPDEIREVFKDGFSLAYGGATFGTMFVDGIEVATFRGERYNGNGHKDVVTTYVETIEEDLSRRDFTMNAMAIDRFGSVIDPFGGVADMTAGNIRFVGSPVDRLLEDPNRLLRLARFMARFDLDLDPGDLTSISNLAPALFPKIAPERIRGEILKTVSSVSEASKFFGILHTLGILDLVFPGMEASVGHSGGNHHLETVWEHMMLVGDSISIHHPLVKLAGYLHDIGKPKAFEECEGLRFAKHEHIGEEMVVEILRNLKFSNKEIETVSGLVRVHMRLAKDSMSHKARRRTVKLFAEKGLSWKDFVRLRLADTVGNLNVSDPCLDDIRSMVRAFTETNSEGSFISVHDLAVSGGELIEHFGLVPGKIVGDTQKHLLEFVLDNGPEANVPEVLFAEASNFLS